MPPPRTTRWSIDPHTAVKHSILRRYLQAFFPILGSWTKRVAFVDGFAGPGEYADGEPGSPLIALDAALEHHHDLSRCELQFLFIEEDQERLANLRRLVAKRLPPPNVRVDFRQGAFASWMADVQRTVGAAAASLTMVDPFGVKGVPIALLGRLGAYQRSELLVSFMFEPITRFLGTPEFEPHLTDLFGSEAWRKALPLQGDARKDVLKGLYEQALRGAGFPYVRSFELRDRGNRTEYYLMFATHHKSGLKAMKAAMWNVDRSGGMEFSDATDPRQQTLFEAQPDYTQLRGLILTQFAGVNTTVTQIEDYVLVDTAFRETHFKGQILRPLERDGLIEVDREGALRGYPPTAKVRFL